KGACVGTGSPRRKAQLLARRPDLLVKDLRGNVETRLKKLDEGQMDAVILACAGLTRLGLKERITERLPLKSFIPAPGQGALGITIRSGDKATASRVAGLNDLPSASAVAAERAFLLHLGGGCKTPIACHGSFEEDSLVVAGFVSSPDGKTFFEKEITGNGVDGESLGRTLAELMLEAGAGDLLDEEVEEHGCA
ncbi:MAG: hydroxymethylbilane synthase, partial [Planctomycetes bacterium]|nr:hydroxymethylbilane synthase [Planctomycetota bacterium]